MSENSEKYSSRLVSSLSGVQGVLNITSLTFGTVEPVNVWHFCLTNDLSICHLINK